MVRVGWVYNAYSVYVETPLPLVAVGLTYFKLSKFDFFDRQTEHSFMSIDKKTP